MRNITALLLFALLIPNAAYAQSLSPTGTITRIWAAGGQNYGFRVFLSNNGFDPLNGCSSDFAYLNTDNDNYQAIVSTLLSNYQQGKQVVLHLGKSGDFCRINEVEG